MWFGECGRRGAEGGVQGARSSVHYILRRVTFSDRNEDLFVINALSRASKS